MTKGRGKSDTAKILRRQYEQAIQQKLSQEAPCASWEHIAALLTSTAGKVFGFTQPEAAKPWFIGRQSEIRALNAQVSAAKQRLLLCTQAHRNDPRNPSAVQQQQQAKTALHRVKRQRKRTFAQWERRYWNDIGEQAEIAESHGGTYTLFSILKKLKQRKSKRGRPNVRYTTRNPSRKLHPGEPISKPSKMETHRYPNRSGRTSHQTRTPPDGSVPPPLPLNSLAR